MNKEIEEKIDHQNVDIKSGQISSEEMKRSFENLLEKLSPESISQDLTLKNLDKSEQVKIGLIKIIDFIKKNENKLLVEFKNTDKIRIQRKSQKPFLPFSFELHYTPDDWVLHVLLKSKGGILNASGSQKTIKDSVKFHKKWQVEVNITACDEMIEEVSEEAENSQLVNSKHVLIITEGCEYDSFKSEDSKGLKSTKIVHKKSFFCDKAELGDLFNFYRDVKLPRDFNLCHLISVCLSSAIGLADVHQNQLIHRDIKLRNILLFRDANGFYYSKIIDLGLAIKIGIFKEIYGTEIYSSPRLVLGMGRQRNIKLYEKQLKIIESRKLTEHKIVPSKKVECEDDVWALVHALLQFCEIFKDSTKISTQVNDALVDLVEILEDVETFPERYTSVQLVEELKKFLINLPDKFPGMDWEKLIAHCLEGSGPLIDPIVEEPLYFPIEEELVTQQPEQTIVSHPEYREDQKELVTTIITRIEEGLLSYHKALDGKLSQFFESSLEIKKISSTSWAIHDAAYTLLEKDTWASEEFETFKATVLQLLKELPKPKTRLFHFFPVMECSAIKDKLYIDIGNLLKIKDSNSNFLIDFD